MENLNKIESIENTNEINKENIQDIQYIDLARIEPVIRNDIPGYDEAIVTCDPFSVAHVLDSKQGDNVFGYQSNCGLVSISNVLQLSGINATERYCRSCYFPTTCVKSTFLNQFRNVVKIL